MKIFKLQNVKSEDARTLQSLCSVLMPSLLFQVRSSARLIRSRPVNTRVVFGAKIIALFCVVTCVTNTISLNHLLRIYYMNAYIIAYVSLRACVHTTSVNVRLHPSANVYFESALSLKAFGFLMANQYFSIQSSF